MGESYDHDKRRIRRGMEPRRARLTPDEIARLSAAACDRVVALAAFAAARHVVVYLPIGGEMDSTAIADRALADGKRVYHPKGGSRTPGFVLAGAPDAGSGPPIPSPDVLFVVPGVAFDLRGARLGRGSGWYDRALAAHPGGVRVGLAYDFQLVPVLPEAPWDVRMDAVATDVRLVVPVVAGDPRTAVKENRT